MAKRVVRTPDNNNPIQVPFDVLDSFSDFNNDDDAVQEEQSIRSDTPRRTSSFRLAWKRSGLIGVITVLFDWIYRNQWVFLVLGLIGLALGVLFNKYISVVTAVILVLLGIFCENQEDENDAVLAYIVAVIIFIAPFMW